MESLIFPLLIMLLFVPLFLSYRRQRKQFNDVQQLQRSLLTGDRVMTTSGVYGTIVALADDTVDLEIAPRVVTTWSRAAVRERITATDGGAKTESEVTADEPDSR